MAKRFIIVGLAGAIVCTGAAVVIIKGRPTREQPLQMTIRLEEQAAPTTGPARAVEEPVEVLTPATQPTPAAPITVAVNSPPTPPPAKIVTKKPAKQNATPPKPKQSGQGGSNRTPPTADQIIARQALSLVGTDPDAEAVWADAINDPSRTEHERKDLIEDLNEEGFDDPKHVTPDDLPLIANRLAIIEQLAPFAMDDVNNEAFAEAYKDLINMYTRASQQ